MSIGAVPISITGARSRLVSKPRLGISEGFTAWVSNTNTKVCPSGAARAAAAVPSAPLAPGRLSTTIGAPSSPCKRACTSRASVSTLPPGGKGTTMRIGPLGQPAGG